MNLERYRHPVRFYLLATLIPWAFWAVAAFASHQDATFSLRPVLMSVFGLLGLAAPVAVALGFFLKDRALLQDLAGRFFNFQKRYLPWYVITLGLLPASILGAMAISVAFGYPASQFVIRGLDNFDAGLFPAWVLLLLAPALEELAWHSYGTDCLRRRMSLFTATMVFAVLWAVWHMPLGMVKDYYHAELVEEGVLHSLNFIVSIFPFAILMNWLYMRTGRNVLVTIVFHISANIFNELFATHPDSKLIQTALLLVLAVVVLVVDRHLFFRMALPENDTLSIRRAPAAG